MLLNRNNDRTLKITRTESFLFIPDEREKNLNFGMDGCSEQNAKRNESNRETRATCLGCIRVSLNPHVRWLLVIGRT